MLPLQGLPSFLRVEGVGGVREDEAVLFSWLFSSISLVLSALLLTPVLTRNSYDPSDVTNNLFSLLPTTVLAMHFYREKTSALSFLVYSRPFAPTHATWRF